MILSFKTRGTQTLRTSRLDSLARTQITTFQYLHNEANVLVIGAGGLGCEILKCLVLSGFSRVDVIDMDTVDLSNLNRQFLFRDSDIGKPKAVAAAGFINRRFSHLGVQVSPHVSTIQEKPVEFYRRFNVIIAGLDNIDARRWINSLLHSMADRDPLTGDVDPSSIIPLFDGGTEGLRGQSRTILPFMTSCFECSLGTFPPKTTYPLCTIAETPRLPEHCVEYVYLIEWPKQFPDQKADLDDPEVLKWITALAKERAEMFKIEGVNEMLTMGVVKRIVPAVASTNALIAAMLVSEALKISTYCGPVLNSYLMYMGQSGVYTYTFPFAKNEVRSRTNSNETQFLDVGVFGLWGDSSETQCNEVDDVGESLAAAKRGSSISTLESIDLHPSSSQRQSRCIFFESSTERNSAHHESDSITATA
ncbi:NEDD8-activating enzyme E1 catalytic subunit-like [Condylostylus longicornis]|uniref:NEDD8-activating enzyme E1 catalytic subunit-like n=1 Tax=Condylostylus longicornis TaxID=2530218 RepID=UPI00244DF5BA|nr:NEDD8-activating enzyme E1 catalytic subunit-like [Condylostylus longicornis]